MALITAAARNQLTALFVGMFKAAPGAANLSSMVSAYEAGSTMDQIAANLATKADFSVVYPGFLTGQEFADRVVANLLPAGTDSGAKAWSTDWILGKLNAGETRATIISKAVKALNETVNPKYDLAKAQQANKVTAANYYSITKEQSSASLAELQAVVSGVTEVASTIETSMAAVDTGVLVAIGQTYTLTTSVDAMTGTVGNDTFNGQVSGVANTFSGLDSVDGGDGDDTLNIFDPSAPGTYPAGTTIKNIETVNVSSTGALTFDTSKGYTGLTALNVPTSNGAVNITAAATTKVAIVDTAGTVTASGGASQSVTTAGGFVLSGSKGAVTVTDTAQAAVNSSVNGGTDVTVTTTSAAAAGGTVTVGSGTTVPTGAVKVTQNSSGAAGGLVTVKGGTSVWVAANATNAVNTTTTIGDINVDGNGTATTVTVNQTAAATAAATGAAVAAVTEVATVTFAALAASATAVVGGLTFTAGTAGTTAAQTAAAFANLKTGALQGNSSLGTYTGSVTAAYSSGAANAAVVTFTSNTAGAVADLTVTGPAISIVPGVTAVAATGKAGVVNGAVAITDGGATDAIATVNLKEYASNATIASDALTTLSLTNGTGTATVTNTKATTLALIVDKVTAGVNIGGVYTTVNATAMSNNSTFSLTAGGVKTLNVAGDKVLDLSGAALGAVTTVAVTGTAGLKLNAGDAATITSVNTSGTTGTTTVTIDSTKATYTGGDGADVVSSSNATAPTKAISLGAGNDSFAINASSSTSTVDGGAGTDTLIISAANAAVADDTATFATKVIGFEVLSLTAPAAEVIDTSILGFSMISTGGATGALTLNKVASGGTLTLTSAVGAGSYVVGVTDAATGTADVLNVAAKAGGANGSVTANSVETINVSSATGANTLKVVATSATAINVSGDKDINLTVAGNTKVATINASSLTGALTVTAPGTSTTTITGGSGNDVLTASTGTVADTLIGGAGNDTLTSNQGLSQMTGGAGADKFIITIPANLNSYSTITDATAGDMIQLTNLGTETFQKSPVSLAATAVFQDYANAAVNAGGDASGNGYIAWFQYAGDTYIVQSQHNALPAGTQNFQNGSDSIVKLTGLIDLSTASLNIDTPTLLLG